MVKKHRPRSPKLPNEAAVAAELKAAEADWKDAKCRARAAKAAAKDAKKAVKRLRKLLLASKEEPAARNQARHAKRSRAQDQPATRAAAKKRLRIAGTPEKRRSSKKNKTTFRESSREQSPASQVDTTAQDTAVPLGGDDSPARGG